MEKRESVTNSLQIPYLFGDAKVVTLERILKGIQTLLLLRCMPHHTTKGPNTRPVVNMKKSMFVRGWELQDSANPTQLNNNGAKLLTSSWAHLLLSSLFLFFPVSAQCLAHYFNQCRIQACETYVELGIIQFCNLLIIEYTNQAESGMVVLWELGSQNCCQYLFSHSVHAFRMFVPLLVEMWIINQFGEMEIDS